MKRFIQGFLLVLLCGTAGFVDDSSAAEAPDVSKVGALVRQLGDERFSTREQAERELKKIGEPVAEPLRAFLDDPDPEVRFRVRKVLDHVASLQRELRWIDPKLAGKGEYVSETIGRGVKLTFRNESKKPVRIFWMGFDNTRESWRGLLKPGDTAVCARSYLGHIWVITDADEKPLAAYRVDIDDPVIVVRDADFEK